MNEGGPASKRQKSELCALLEDISNAQRVLGCGSSDSAHAAHIGALNDAVQRLVSDYLSDTTDAATGRAVLAVVESLVAEQCTPLHAPMLTSAALRLFQLATRSDDPTAANDSSSSNNSSDDVPVARRAADVCGECLWCLVLVDTRQFEDAVTDLVRFLHVATHATPPFEAPMGALLGTTQPQTSSSTATTSVTSTQQQHNGVVCGTTLHMNTRTAFT